MLPSAESLEGKSVPHVVFKARPDDRWRDLSTDELFKGRTGITAEHVPYRGDAPLITDLLSGLVNCSFATLSAVLPYIKKYCK